MIAAIHTIWPLMLGYFFVMLGQGLHSTLIGIRANAESFDSGAIGIVIACYTGGMLFGTYLAERIIQRIGHIRAYALASSISSCALLMYIMVIDPVLWGFARFFIGVAMAILYSATESWLNDSAENHNRGQFLSVYMIVTNLGMGFGQYLLLVGSPEGSEQFILLSILFSLSVIPILLTVRNVPSFDSPKPMSLKKLYNTTPFGFVNMIFIGIIYSTLFVMAGVYTSLEGFSLFETSLFVSVLILAPAISQSPIGKLSDQMDRRLVIIPLIIVSIGLLLVFVIIPELSIMYKIVLIGLLASAMIPVHGLVMAHTNDFMNKDELVGASTAMIRLFAFGSMIAPPVVGFVMELAGGIGYFYFMLIMSIGMLAYSVTRVGMRWGSLDDQTRYVGLPRTTGLHVATTMLPEAETLEQGYTVLEEDNSNTDPDVDK